MCFVETGQCSSRRHDCATIQSTALMAAANQKAPVCILLLLTWSAPICVAAAPATLPGDPVPQALLRFLAALDSADAPVLRQLIYASEKSLAQQAGRDALVELIVAQAHLERATASRFPNQSHFFRRHLDQVCSLPDRSLISSANVAIEESRNAKLVLPNETSPVKLRQSAAGQWQIVLDVIEPELDDAQYRARGQGLTQFRIDRLRAFAAAFEMVAKTVESGGYADAQAAETALMDRVTAARTNFRTKLQDLTNRRRYRSDEGEIPD